MVCSEPRQWRNVTEVARILVAISRIEICAEVSALHFSCYRTSDDVQGCIEECGVTRTIRCERDEACAFVGIAADYQGLFTRGKVSDVCDATMSRV